jgi:hypothetical protein
MITVEVDLAATPEPTALASIEWTADRTIVRDVIRPADDDVIIEAIKQADMTRDLDPKTGVPGAHRQGQTSVGRVRLRHSGGARHCPSAAPPIRFHSPTSPVVGSLSMSGFGEQNGSGQDNRIHEQVSSCGRRIEVVRSSDCYGRRHVCWRGYNKVQRPEGSRSMVLPAAA